MAATLPVTPIRILFSVAISALYHIIEKKSAVQPIFNCKLSTLLQFAEGQKVEGRSSSLQNWRAMMAAPAVSVADGQSSDPPQKQPSVQEVYWIKVASTSYGLFTLDFKFLGQSQDAPCGDEQQQRTLWIENKSQVLDEVSPSRFLFYW